MRTPDALASLSDYGILDDIVRPLMSGKEAQVYLVHSGGNLCVAKVYKEAQNRSFKNRAEYTEGRKVRNTRDQRAIDKRSKHGREQDEAAWRSTEVDMIRRLHSAGVRVPTPYHFIDGVLIMELITDANGDPAPRLGDVSLDQDTARQIYDRMIGEVVKMLCAGVVHGDLSDFNILLGADGPVIIDFPQSVDTAANTNARRLLVRDVDNLHNFLGRFVQHPRRFPYAYEMWDLYQQNLLTPETRLTGRFKQAERRVNMDSVLDLISDANYDEQQRRQKLGIKGPAIETSGSQQGGVYQGRGGYQGGGPRPYARPERRPNPGPAGPNPAGANPAGASHPQDPNGARPAQPSHRPQQQHQQARPQHQQARPQHQQSQHQQPQHQQPQHPQPQHQQPRPQQPRPQQQQRSEGQYRGQRGPQQQGQQQQRPQGGGPQGQNQNGHRDSSNQRQPNQNQPNQNQQNDGYRGSRRSGGNSRNVQPNGGPRNQDGPRQAPSVEVIVTRRRQP